MNMIVGTVNRDGSIRRGDGFKVKIAQELGNVVLYDVTLPDDTYTMIVTQRADTHLTCCVNQQADNGLSASVCCPTGGVNPGIPVFSFIAVKS